MVANAPIQAKNLGTGVEYSGATSTTGNYTLSQLPAGSYQITVTVPGFKKYSRTGLTVEVAQTLRVDISPGSRLGHRIGHRNRIGLAPEDGKRRAEP